MASPALSWDITATTPISFGSVAPGPSNAVLEIDARAGFARPTAASGTPILIPPLGYSGWIRITSNSTEAGQLISLTFPPSLEIVLLNSIHTPLTSMRLTGFSALSQTTVTAVHGDVEIFLGGRLEVKEYQVPGDYHGNMVITVVF